MRTGALHVAAVVCTALRSPFRRPATDLVLKMRHCGVEFTEHMYIICASTSDAMVCVRGCACVRGCVLRYTASLLAILMLDEACTVLMEACDDGGGRCRRIVSLAERRDVCRIFLGQCAKFSCVQKKPHRRSWGRKQARNETGCGIVW